MLRLDRVLANLNVGTRKEVKAIIRKGQVKVNGEVIINDDHKIDEENDAITINDEPIIYQKTVYMMLNKPSDVVSVTEDTMHTTVLDLVPNVSKGMFCAGRLDMDTEGLCLITNDGQLAHQLLSPKHHVEKTYLVICEDELREEDIKQIEQGMMIDDIQLKPARIEHIDTSSYYLHIKEGKYHQIKRMMKELNNKVIYLKRLAIGSLTLDEDLEPGQWRYLTPQEIEQLKAEN